MNHPTLTPLSLHRRGFTLVELMVSTALIALLMLLLLGTVDQTQNIWKRTTAKVTQFQASRAAFEAMNRRLSQATLNTYYRPVDTTSGNSKAEYLFRRQSELHFISGHLADATTSSGRIPGIFTANPSIAGLTRPTERAYPTHGVFFYAPLGITEEPGSITSGFEKVRRFRGLDAMLTACGYFIEYGDDPWRPKVLPLATETEPGVPPRIRFRLMELSVPAEELMIFNRSDKVGGNDNDLTLSNPNAKPPTTKWIYSSSPQVLNRATGHYIGRTTTLGNPPNEKIGSNSTWIRPFWMENTSVGGKNYGALFRNSGETATSGTSANTTNRFAYGRVMADNIIALVVLPKLSEKDRSNPEEIGSLAPEYQYDSWRILQQDAGAAGAGNAARDNKLPPIVQIVMVAIDEASALKLPRNTVPDWTIRDRQLFTKIRVQDDLLKDMAELETRLQKDKISYRVFSTDVVLRSSKWSKDPAN